MRRQVTTPVLAYPAAAALWAAIILLAAAAAIPARAGAARPAASCLPAPARAQAVLEGRTAGDVAPRAQLPARWVDVSVATLWVKPRLTRSVDRWSSGNPADPRAWVRHMSTSEKYWLNGKLETQALYGTKVLVLATSGSWSKVAVTGQPTPRNPLGYPGWLPTGQLTTAGPAAAPRTAVVRTPTVWLYADAGLTTRATEISCATALPAVRWTAASVEVVMLDGRRLYLPRPAVVLRAPGKPWPKPTGPAVVRQAKRFLGLEYLYGGTSGFAFDCSGFTHTIYKSFGVTIPRDADAQAVRGRRIASRTALQPGDLVFFRSSSGYVHHVGMYIGGGRMIHSPHTGAAVQLVSLAAEPYRTEFAGGRRYAAVLER